MLSVMKKSLKIPIFVGYNGYIVACHFFQLLEQPKTFSCCTK